MVVQFEIVCIKSFGLVLEFEMYQCIFNVFGTPFLFQFPRGSYLFLEGLTFVGIIWVTCAILEATRATFLEVLYSSVDTPGSETMYDHKSENLNILYTLGTLDV